jgi:hypothetical protein
VQRVSFKANKIKLIDEDNKYNNLFRSFISIMAKTNFVTPDTFDISRVRPGMKPNMYDSKGTNGALDINYLYENGVVDPLFIFVDFEVYLTFGLNSYQHKPDAKIKWSTDLSFWKMEENPKLLKLYQVCMQLDEFILNYYHSHYEEWFGVKKSLEVLKDRFYPMVRDKHPGKYAPVLGVSANPNKNGVFPFTIFDHNMQQLGTERRDADGNLIEIEVRAENVGLLPPKCPVKVLLAPCQMWFNTTVGFGPSVTPKQFQKPAPKNFHQPVTEPIGFDGTMEVDNAVTKSFIQLPTECV